MPSDPPTLPRVHFPGGGVDDLSGLQTENCELLRRGDNPGVPEPGGSGGEDPGERGCDAGEEPSCLAESVKLWMPEFTAAMGPRERALALQDHILATALMRGRLAELRLNAQVNLRDAREQLRGEPAMRTGRSAKATEEMKLDANPDLARRIAGARWLIDRCTEEMDRLGGNDYEAASRSFTILVGG